MSRSKISYLSLLGLAVTVASHAVPRSSGWRALNNRRMDTSFTNSTCRNIPGDAGWPTADSWARLNATVDGRLLATVPIAHVCHEPTYDEEACNQVVSQWNMGQLMTTKPAEIMAPWFQNQSCVPFTNPSAPCDLGNLASYTIDVSNADDVAAGLSFAKEQNIRLVIKNSGHDFSGRSTGKGALSLWTHNLDSMELISTYNASYYSGPAIKIGAGVSGGAAAEFASKYGYRIVVGSCPTVGAAGGYTQGGGHSLLTGAYGFGADNVLEWEVATTTGQHIVASPTQNPDLYWALSGGGGGTYGVVVSMTSRVFADGPIAAATMGFNASVAGGTEEYWDAVEVFLEQLKPLVDDAGVVAEFFIANDTLQVFGLMGPHHTAEQLTTVLSPLTSSVNEVLVAHKNGNTAITAAQNLNLVVSEDNGYFDLYAKVVRPTLVNATESVAIGGHYVSRTNMATNSSAVLSALRHTTDGGKFSIGITAFNLTGANREAAPPVASNAVQAQAQDAFLSLIIQSAGSKTLPWADALALQDELHDNIMPFVNNATPGAGAYGNEANWDQDDWQNAFYGDHYSRLREIKNTYDPDSIFYGLTTVGSDAWAEDAEGRLCRTGL